LIDFFSEVFTGVDYWAYLFAFADF